MPMDFPDLKALQDVPLHRLCRIAQASEFALRLLHQAEQRRAAFAEDEATRMACSDCADLRARLAADRCAECAGHSSGVAYCVNCGRPMAWKSGEERLTPGELKACLAACEEKAAAYREGLDEACQDLDALRTNVADLTASLKVAQESLRQREAAQRAAEQERDHWHQIVTDSSAGVTCLPTCNSFGHADLCPLANPGAAVRDAQERLETQIQAAFVAQEAQIAQGWKLHEAEQCLALADALAMSVEIFTERYTDLTAGRLIPAMVDAARAYRAARLDAARG